MRLHEVGEQSKQPSVDVVVCLPLCMHSPMDTAEETKNEVITNNSG